MLRVTRLHILDGRIRMRCPALIGAPSSVATSFKKTLTRLDGVQTVLVGRHSGTLIINFACDTISADRILQALDIDPSQALMCEASAASSPPITDVTVTLTSRDRAQRAPVRPTPSSSL